MFSKVTLAALAAATLVSAQTYTDCNPLDKTCPADSAVGKNKIDCDWTKGACDAFEELPGTTLSYNSNGAVFSIEKETNAPTIRTGKYIFFGRLDVEVQAANGNGIVTSAVLQSDDLDEIDWEWVGGDNTQAQSNYFGKGDTTTYDRGAYHTVDTPLTSFHTYSVEWTSKSVQWIIDGAVVRTLDYADAQGGSRFPQTPMEVKIGTWCAGGKDSAEGTREWAGGYTNFADAPFNAYYKSISVVDYAGKDAPTSDSIKEYIYGDKSGSFESIKIVKGDGSSDDGDDTTTTTKATSTKATATKTKEPKTTTTEAAETTTKEEKTTTKTKEPKTTSAAVTSSFTTTTSSAPNTTTAEETTPASTTTDDAPAATTTDAGDDATRGAAALGGAALAGAFVILAQLL